ncbi:MAG: hypothetical protein LBT47_06155 [Deltaproteobacteria bacterium]|jgi:uncharacterized protein YycO|nr:hypothetical protein [Deltaproteobacteria bacterium]
MKSKSQPYLRPPWSLIFLFLWGCFFLSGCAVKAIVKEPQPVELNLEQVRAVIESGDWLVTRETTIPGNFFGTLTNMPFSHAAVYDAENDQVIESERHGVHQSTLEDFLARASRIWVLKPVWATPETRPLVVALARSLVGRPYDFTGLIGLNLDDRYYCSELVISVWKPFMGDTVTNTIPPVVAPGQLHHWGRVVYDSIEIGLGRVPDKTQEKP